MKKVTLHPQGDQEGMPAGLVWNLIGPMGQVRSISFVRFFGIVVLTVGFSEFLVMGVLSLLFPNGEAGVLPALVDSALLSLLIAGPLWFTLSLALRTAQQTITDLQVGLGQSEEFLNSVLNSLSTHFAVLDADGFIVAVNKAWRTFAEENGLRLKNAGVGYNYFAYCEDDPVIGHQAKLGIQSVLKGERDLFEIEYPCHGPSVERWFLLRCSPCDIEGKRMAVVGHINVTDRKLAELEVQRAKERYQLALESGDKAVFDWNLETDEILCSKRMLEAIDLPESAPTINGDLFRSFLHPDDATEFNKGLSVHLKSRQPKFSRQLRFMCPGRPDTYFLLEATTLRNEQFHAERLVGMLTDVTATVSARMAEEGALALLQSVFVSCPVAYLVWDLSGKIVLWNKRCEDLFGWSEGEVQQMPDSYFLFPESSYPSFTAFLSQCLVHGGGSNATFHCQTKAGDTLKTRWQSMPSRACIYGGLALVEEVAEKG